MLSCPVRLVGEYQLTEWVQNLLQLSGYYVSERGYAIAEHCMKAAEEVRCARTHACMHID